MTNEEGMVSDILVTEPLGKSDHAVLTFLFHCYHPGDTSVKTKFNYNKGQYEMMKDSLGEIDWSSKLQNLDVEQSWAEITRSIHAA